MSKGYNPYRDKNGKFASGPGGNFAVGSSVSILKGSAGGGIIKEGIVKITGFKDGKVQLSHLTGEKTKYSGKIPQVKKDTRGLHLGKPIY